jgi:serine/threonine-protein kinase RsbW
MSADPAPAPGFDPSLDRIELTVPLRTEFAATVRTIAASLGADLGFSVDEIDDVRLGISEVYSVLVECADDSSSRASVVFAAGSDHLEVGITADGWLEDVELDELATSILRSVTDEFDVGMAGVTMIKRGVESASTSAAR